MKKVVDSRGRFLRDVKKLASVGSKGLTLDSSGHLLFFDSKMALKSSDAIMFCESPLPGRFSVRLDLIVNLLSKIPADEISMKVGDDELLVEWESGSGGIRKIEADPLVIEEPETWHDAPESFNAVVKSACACANTEDSLRRAYNCIRISPNSVEATDGRQLYMHKWSVELEADVFVLADVVQKAVSQMDAISKIAMSDEYFFLSDVNDVCLAIRKADGSGFPKLSNVIDSLDGKQVKLPVIPSNALGVVKVFTEDTLRKVLITIEDNKVVLESRIEDGWAREVIPCEYQDDPIKVAVNVDFVGNVFASTDPVIVSDTMVGIVGSDNIYIVATID